jgi:2'-5' RNA ligase
MKKLALLLALFYTLATCPVVILVDAPESIKALLKKAEMLVQKQVEKHNQHSEQKYLFEKNCYEPHITLSYICNEPLTQEELQEREPGLTQSIAELASKSFAIDLSAHLKDINLTVWPSTNISTYEGATYKNYAILVIKLTPPEELLKLVKALDNTLAKHPLVKPRKFPFAPHFTIGYVYDVKDANVETMIEIVKPKLQQLLKEFTPGEKFTINSCTLSTNDKKNIIFPFCHAKL